MSKPRLLEVFVTSVVIEDGQVPELAVGSVARLRLMFDEGEAVGHRPVRARAEPIGTSAPTAGLRWDGVPHDAPPRWPTLLHGDGWQATWVAPRPVVGEIAVTGRFRYDLMSGDAEPVRGLVRRIRLVPRAPVATTNGGSPPGEDTELPDVLSVGRSCEGAGVLVDLDLDDVPLPPLRPSVVVSSASAFANRVWVADARLPIAVRLGAGADLLQVRWPGGILSSDDVGSRALHADAGGCWLVGADGARYLSGDASVDLVDERPVWLAALARNTLTVIGPDGCRLLSHGREPRIVDIDVGSVQSAADCLDDVLLLCVDQSGSQRLCRVGADGQVTTGRALPADPHHRYRVLLGGRRPMVLARRRLLPVLPDLTLGDPIPVPVSPLFGCASGDRAWLLTHPGSSAWLPSSHPTGLSLERRHWLLVELDTRSMLPIGSTFVPGVPAQVATTSDGSVYTVADGLRRCPPGWGTVAEPIDVAALVDQADRADRPTDR